LGGGTRGALLVGCLAGTISTTGFARLEDYLLHTHNIQVRGRTPVGVESWLWD
jgi:hypothetical protein